MTNYMKRVEDARAAFQKKMDTFGLKVDGGEETVIKENERIVIFKTACLPVKGNKKLMGSLAKVGYDACKYRQYESRHSDKYCIVFYVEEIVIIDKKADDKEEYVEPQQENEAEAASDFNNRKEFAVRVIAKGDFLDRDPSYNGKVYQVETATIRLNPAALNEWILTRRNRAAAGFATQDEYRAWQEEQTAAMGKLRRKIAEAAGFREIDPCAEPSVEQIISEVFAVAYIHEYKGAE